MPLQPVLYVRPSPRFENLSRNSRNADRASLVRSLIASTGLEDRCKVIAPREATRDEVGLAHSRRYLSLLARLSRRESVSDDANDSGVNSDEDSTHDIFGYNEDEYMEDTGLVDDCAIFPGVWELAKLTVGGAVNAAELLMSKESSVACWFEGGRHHAASDSAAGFCYCKDDQLPHFFDRARCNTLY